MTMPDPGPVNPLEIDGLKLSLAEIVELLREATRLAGDRFASNERSITSLLYLCEELTRGTAHLATLAADLDRRVAALESTP